MASKAERLQELKLQLAEIEAAYVLLRTLVLNVQGCNDPGCDKDRSGICTDCEINGGDMVDAVLSTVASLRSNRQQIAHAIDNFSNQK